MRHRFHLGVVTFATVLLGGVAPVLAGWADDVIRYTPGSAASYTTSSSALGKPASTLNTPYDYWWDNVHYVGVDQSILTPFNATYNPDHMVAIGAGGELVLHLSTPAATTGKTIGVHAAVGLSDASWPGGTNLPVATPYTSPRVAVVSVAQTLENWVSLGEITFDIPTNYYSAGITSPASTTTPGTQEADFFKPFLGQLSGFDGTDWTGTLATLDNSAGGTWLDLSGTGLSSVNYIRFAVPTGSADTMFVDAVASVPEPASLGLLAAGGLLLLRRRRARA